MKVTLTPWVPVPVARAKVSVTFFRSLTNFCLPSDQSANIFPEFDSFFDTACCSTEPLNKELTSPDLHPLLAKGNSSKGVSKRTTNTCEVNSILHSGEVDSEPPTGDTLNAHSASQLNGPSVFHPFSGNFSDKRRRLLSTPLLTGYYVSDRPPDGPSHNNREC